MKTSFRLLILVAVIEAVVLPRLHAQASAATVDRPEKRERTLRLAVDLLKPRESPTAHLPAELMNPFNPAGFGKDVPPPSSPESSPAVPHASSDREVLQAIAAGIKPAGAAMIGGKFILILGQKKLKVGDGLTINFEGRDYLIKVTAVTANTFTIRLNNEEISRPTK